MPTRAYHDESLTIRRQMGDRGGIAAALNGLGILTRSQGDYPSARVYFEECLAIRKQIGDRSGKVAARGDRFAPGPNDRAPYDREVAAARMALGAEAFSAAWRQGRAMPIERAIDYGFAVDTG